MKIYFSAPMLIFNLMCIFFSFRATAEPNCFDVRLSERRVICISHGIGSISAESRAQVIEGKLEKIANDYSFDPEKILVIEGEDDFSITADEQNLISMREKDKPDPKISLKEFADSVAANVKLGVAEYRTQKSPRTIVIGAIYSIIATLFLVLVWIATRKAQVFLFKRLSVLSERYVAKLKIKSYQLVSPHRVNQLLMGIIVAAKIIFRLILLYIYISLVLSFFPWTAQWAPKIINYVLDPIKHLAHTIIIYIPNLFYIAIILGFTHYLMKFVRLFFNEIELGHLSFNGFHKEWAQPTFKLLKVIAYAISFIMIFPYLPGSSSPAFQGISVFLGVLVSFGSGSAIANMISGIVMTYMRPFRIGDRVRIADTVGDVIEKTFLVTRIKTIKNVEVTIPNAMVLGSHIVNYSTSAQEDGLILHTTITIGYDAPWVKVQELLKLAASRTEWIDQEKPAFILQTSLDDFYVSYELNAYTKYANKMAGIYSDLHRNIQDSFNEGGIEIMSPHYGALRDGNEITIPSSKRPSDYRPSAFKVSVDSISKEMK